MRKGERRKCILGVLDNIDDSDCVNVYDDLSSQIDSIECDIQTIVDDLENRSASDGVADIIEALKELADSLY